MLQAAWHERGVSDRPFLFYSSIGTRHMRRLKPVSPYAPCGRPLDVVQVAALCGVHCINALLQGPYFSEVDLAQVIVGVCEQMFESSVKHAAIWQHPCTLHMGRYHPAADATATPNRPHAMYNAICVLLDCLCRASSMQTSSRSVEPKTTIPCKYTAPNPCTPSNLPWLVPCHICVV